MSSAVPRKCRRIFDLVSLLQRICYIGCSSISCRVKGIIIPCDHGMREVTGAITGHPPLCPCLAWSEYNGARSVEMQGYESLDGVGTETDTKLYNLGNTVQMLPAVKESFNDFERPLERSSLIRNNARMLSQLPRTFRMSLMKLLD